MPATFTVGPQRVVIHPEGSRVSSGGSASVRSPASTSGSHSHSGSAESSSWDECEPPYEDDDDGIEPSDSASRARQPSLRIETGGSRPESRRRRSSRRREGQEEVGEEPPRRHRSSRKHHPSRPSRRRHGESRRVPSDESSSTVASHDDYPYGHHGVPPNRRYPPQPGYGHVPPPGPGGYPPSMTSAPGGFPDPYAAQALVHMPQQDPYGFGHGNPFVPITPQGNPFTPMGSTISSGYFSSDPHAPMPHHPHRPSAPPRPQSFIAPASHYGSDMMSPYGHPGMHPYYGMHPGMAPYPAIPPWYQHPSNHSTPAPSGKEEKGNEEIIAFFKKQEEVRIAREEAALKRAEEQAAATAARQARDEEEKKKQAEIAAAAKKAKEDAEKKAEEAVKKLKDEHEKKVKESEQAREELEKKQKASEEEVKKLQPGPDSDKAPIKFNDAVGRKFSFPFHLCKTWKGMEGLIKQAFLHVDVIGEHVHQGHYDLQGPDGEIILSQVWESMIQPGWEISMHMWPMPELGNGKQPDPTGIVDPFAHLGLGDIGIVDTKKPKKKASGSKKKHDPNVINFDVLPPPPNFPAGILPPDPFAVYPPILPPEDPKKDKPKRTNTNKSTKSSSGSKGGFASWFAGGSTSRPAKKK